MLALTRSVARNVATEARTSKLLADMNPDNGHSPVARQTAAACLEALRRVFVLEDQPAWPAHLRSRAVLRKSPKRQFVDPSLAAAALAASPEGLLGDTRTLGFLFESLVIRDLRVYSADLAALVVITARGAAYRRPDGVCVTPITSLGP